MNVRSEALTLDSWPAPREPKAAANSPSRSATASPLEANASQADCRRLLLERLDFIERTVTAVARRNAMSPWERDDLAGRVKLRLISNDYAILRKFEGKSRLTTYLTTVIQNLFRDFRIQQWGKWRPSAAAKRLGDLGVQLEALLYRDRFSFHEAVELLRSRYGVEASELELLEVAGALRARTTRRFESDSVLSSLAAAERGDQRVVDGERAAASERVRAALARALAALGSEDRLILKLRFTDGLTIRSIAATLDLDQRGIYTRVRKLLGEVRERIVEQGVRCEEVMDLLDWPACSIEAGLGEAPAAKTA